MRRLLPLLLTLPACSASFSDEAKTPAPEDSTVPEHETAVPGGDTEVDDVGAPDDPPLPPLCDLSLTCGQPIQDEPMITCTVRVVDGYGRVQYDGPAGVELHGRSSLSFPKPQYAIELRNASGFSVGADLLGMGEDADWILNGAYIDRALLRNKLGFDLFQGLGDTERYAPESAYCTLTLEGTWQGIYFLTEKPRRGDERVAIAADDGTGRSFVVKLDDSGGVTANTQGYGYWKLVYPSETDATVEQIAGIAAWIDAWQRALVSADPADPETGVFAYVDEDSAIDFILLEEALKNNDAYFLSVYAWKDATGLLHFAPWDLDLTLGQPLYNDNELYTEWILYRPPWIANMVAIPAFKEKLVARWRELRTGSFSTDQLLARVTDDRDTMGDVVYDNFEVWPIETIQFGGCYLPPVSSYDEEYENVRAWIPERLDWIDAHIEEM